MAVIGLQVQETPHPADHVKDWTPEMRYKRVMVGGGVTQWGNICITHSKKGGLLIGPKQICKMPACPLFRSLLISQSLIRAMPDKTDGPCIP